MGYGSAAIFKEELISTHTCTFTVKMVKHENQKYFWSVIELPEKSQSGGTTVKHKQQPEFCVFTASSHAALIGHNTKNIPPIF